MFGSGSEALWGSWAGGRTGKPSAQTWAKPGDGRVHQRRGEEMGLREETEQERSRK